MTPDIHRSVEADRIPPTWADVQPLIRSAISCTATQMGCLRVFYKPPDVKRAIGIERKPVFDYVAAVEALETTRREWLARAAKRIEEERNNPYLDLYLKFYTNLIKLVEDVQGSSPYHNGNVRSFWELDRGKQGRLAILMDCPEDPWEKIEQINKIGRQLFSGTWPGEGC